MKSYINPRILLFCTLSLSLISWDRVSKDLAKEYLRNQPARTFLHESFRLEYVENTGAAMSLADNLNPQLSFWLLAILPLIILMGLLAYIAVHARNIRRSILMALTLIFAGGMGNILDRLLFDRHVIDFMNVGLLSLRSGIFNFADLWITTGVAWLAVGTLKKTSPANL
jgi:signal peptidase II